MATTETTPKLSKYQQLEVAFGRVAEKWSEDNTELEGEPGSREVFLSMGETALRLAFREFPSWPLNWRLGLRGVDRRPQGALYTGTSVMALHCRNGSVAAGYAGLNESEADAALRDPRSFEPLVEITRHEREIASRVELEYGLHRLPSYSDHSLFVKQKRVTVENGVVITPFLKFQVVRQKLIAQDSAEDGYPVSGDEDTATKCYAHRAGALEPIYHHLVTITGKDSRLGAAALAQGVALS